MVGIAAECVIGEAVRLGRRRGDRQPSQIVILVADRRLPVGRYLEGEPVERVMIEVYGGAVAQTPGGDV